MQFLDAYLDVSQNKAEDFEAARASISALSGTTALTFIKKCSVAIDSLAGVRRGNCIQLQSRLFAKIEHDAQLATLLGTYLLIDEFDTHCGQSRLVALAARNLRLMTNFEKVCALSETIKKLSQGAKGHESLLDFLNTIVENHWCPEMAEHAAEMCKLLKLYDHAFRVVETVVCNLTPQQYVQLDIVNLIAKNYSDCETEKFFKILKVIDEELDEAPEGVPASLVEIARVIVLFTKDDALSYDDRAKYELYCQKLCMRLNDWNVSFELRNYIVANPELMFMYEHTLHSLAPLATEHRFLESVWMLFFDFCDFTDELEVALCKHAESIGEQYTSVADLKQRVEFLHDLATATVGQKFPSSANVVHKSFVCVNYTTVVAINDETDVRKLLLAASATLGHAVFHNQSRWVADLIDVLSANLKLLPPESVPELLGLVRSVVSRVLKMKDPEVVSTAQAFLDLLDSV